MKKHSCYFVSLLSAILLHSCTWDASVYDEYIDPNGQLAKCPGFCEHDRVITDANECTNVGGEWISEINYCEIADIFWTPELCHSFGGTWYGRKGTDLGNGRYILVRNKDPEVMSPASDEIEYICGSYDYVTDTKNPANTCDESEIQTLRHLQRVGLCTAQANHCVLIKTSATPLDDSAVFEPGSNEKTNEYLAICSQCDSGQASCSIDGTSKNTKCVDILSSNDHCGSCLNKCDTKSQQCRGGVCVDVGQCIDGELCDDGTCINPSSIQTCGFKTCEEYNNWKDSSPQDKTQRPYLACPLNAECVMSEITQNYQCTCPYPEDIVLYREADNSYQCLSPSNPLSCGAKAYNNGNEPGIICSGDQQCIKENNQYICKQLCEDGFVFCSDVNSPTGQAGNCVKKLSDEYCGATPDPNNNNVCGTSIHACDPNQNMVCGNDFQCQCKDGLVNCDGKCIDPNTNNDFCGAFGSCSSTDALAGKQCNTTLEHCANGSCVCNSGYVRCGTECIDPKTNPQYCGVNNDCSYEFKDKPAEQNKDSLKGDCSKYNGITLDSHAVCKLESGSANCKCENDKYELAKIDRYGTGATWQCVDPKTDPMYCESCISGNKENCKTNTNACISGYQCSAGKCVASNCNAPKVQCGDMCVDKNTFHVNDTCTACASDYCAENGQVASGCFLNTKTDVNNCGSCGNQCPTGAACVDGKCTCPTGSQECNKDGQKECINLEVMHYSNCYTCKDGWVDADNKSYNGCETNIAHDPDNCGLVGNKCYNNTFYQNVARACADGQCLFTCKAGYATCKTNSNGCETDIQTDVKHCGSCTEDCTRYDYSKNCNHGECCSKDKASYLTTCCDGLYNIKEGNNYSCKANNTSKGCIYRGTGSIVNRNTTCCGDSKLWKDKNNNTYLCSPDTQSAEWCVSRGTVSNSSSCCTDSTATRNGNSYSYNYTCTPN